MVTKFGQSMHIRRILKVLKYQVPSIFQNEAIKDVPVGGTFLVLIHTSDTRAEMHLFLIISINLYDRNSIKFNALASSDVIVLNLKIIHIL